MKTRIIFLTGLILSSLPVDAADYAGYSLDDANRFRRQWTIDNWDDGGPLTRYVFLNMAEFWKHSIINRGGPVRELPEAIRPDVAAFITTTDSGNMSLQDYVNDPRIDGALVLHKGRIVFEAYPQMRQYDKHLYMSVSKPLAATLIAILEDRELVDASKSVDEYIPQLVDSGWAGVPVRDVLDMASGIDCLQSVPGAYDNPELCYYQFEASLGWLRPTSRTFDNTHEYIRSLGSRRP